MSDTPTPQATIQDTVTRLAGPVAASLGLGIWGVEVTSSHRPVIRLFLEGDDGTSATIDQCEEVSRHLSLALDVEEGLGVALPEAYVLEVSTPGLSRLFFSLAQMASYVGDLVEVRLHAPHEQRRTWRGILQGVTDDSMILQPATLTENEDIVPEQREPVQLPWAAVRRANRVAVFPKPVKPGKGPGKGPARAPQRKNPKTANNPHPRARKTVGSCHES